MNRYCLMNHFRLVNGHAECIYCVQPFQIQVIQNTELLKQHLRNAHSNYCQQRIDGLGHESFDYLAATLFHITRNEDVKCKLCETRFNVPTSALTELRNHIINTHVFILVQQQLYRRLDYD
ncbi:uncharacterized protein LOC114936643 [Nylanderia fulva]|uniref:uncharacterized protein LOC114936643 n=1 Tax=Nylanderia fulva TaxID=613905 RepID=UPI0010FB3E15|nr:uncharacterized protein LOC114936643 [Nylanderia fulva]